MTKLWLAVLGVLLGSLPARAAESTPPPVTKRGVMNAIAAFRGAPTSQVGYVAEAMIYKFANDSRDTEVHFSRDLVPWLYAKPEPKHGRGLAIA